MTEQARLTYLQEKIRDAKRNERNGWMVFIVGIIIAVIGGVFIDFSGTGGTLMALCGILGAFLGIFQSYSSRNQYDKSMKELEKMATPNPNCLGCGKELPKGDFAFCPFCGTSFKSQ